MGYNDDVFARILNSVFDVQLPEAEVTLKCRRLPFSTFTWLLGKVAIQAGGAIAELREAFTKLIDTSSSDDLNDNDAEKSVDEVAKDIAEKKRQERDLAIDAGLPVITKLIASSPELLERVLLDVVVDATTEHIRILSTTDALTIFADVLDKADLVVWAEKVRAVFSSATQLAVLAASPKTESK